MKIASRDRARRSLLWSTAVALVIGLPSASWAQMAREAQTGPLEAQAGRTVTFDIPSQPLAQALTAFGRQSGLQVAFDPGASAGKTSVAVSGAMTSEQALRTLLGGSGLNYQFTSAGAVTVSGGGAASTTGAMTLDPVRVQGATAPPQAELGNLPPVFAGGQVARGGKVGILGNRDYMDTPFSETVYTEKYMQEQQAKTLTDVLAGDPTVRSGYPNGNVFDDRVMIRGFQVSNPNFGFGGLYGIAPSQVDLTGIERVEILRGPTAFLNGALPGAVGGTINLVPKRATDAPITQVTGYFQTDAQFGGTVDVGRRFGPENEVGLRANATYFGGETAVNNQASERIALTLGADYRSDNTRIDFDIGFLHRDVDAFQGGMFLAAGVQLPPAPNAARSTYQPWERMQADDLYGALRFEHDFTPAITAFGKVGMKHSYLTSVFLNQNILNYAGNTNTLSAGRYATATDTISVEVGARARFNTGPLRHEAAIVGDYVKTVNYAVNNNLAVPTSSNIYNPVFVNAPNLSGTSINPLKASDSLYTSIGLVDAISIWDDRIQLIGGARYQRLQTANYSAVTALPINGNDQNVISPSLAFVLKPTKEVMLYGNYIQALQQGPVAGGGLTNAGQQFPPFVSNQFELGIKVDFGGFGATLSAFQIRMPSSFTDLTTNTLVQNGLQRNRGLEFVAFGEPFAGLKVLGGFTLLDAILENTQGGTFNGNQAVGTAPFQFSLGFDWDTPFAKGFGVLGRAVYNGQVFLNQANTQAAPPWTRIDAGLRYTFDRTDGKPLTLRANVINLFDANYWIATSSFFVQNPPRTFMLSLTADF